VPVETLICRTIRKITGLKFLTKILKLQVEREAREKETRLLNLVREFEAQNEQLVELDKKHKQLKLEYDDTLSHKDDVGKNVHELEKSKRGLEVTCEEQRQHIEELEDELQAAEDAKLRLEVNMQASRAQLEKKMQETSDVSEEKYKALVKQIRELESDLEDERKQRTSAVHLKKKYELDLNDMKNQFEEANKFKEEGEWLGFLDGGSRLLYTFR
jgi:myosin protein heavy chain